MRKAVSFYKTWERTRLACEGSPRCVPAGPITALSAFAREPRALPGWRAFKLVFLLLLATMSLLAAPKRPNFSGRWELDAAKSQMRPTKWNSLALDVEHQEPKLRIKVTLKYPDGGEYPYQIPLSTDGQPASVDMGKNVRVYRANWRAPQLALKWNEDGERTESWTLAPDGKTLTIIGSAKLTNGGVERWKYVLVKK
jgi:hypothetical protein